MVEVNPTILVITRNENRWKAPGKRWLFLNPAIFYVPNINIDREHLQGKGLKKDTQNIKLV